MKLLALTEGADHVCFRYRIGAFQPALESAGIVLTVAPLARDLRVRLGQLRAASDADVVILQRRLLSRWQLWLLRRAARTLIYDFDDAVFRRSSLSRRRTISWTRRRGFAATVRMADLAIAGNPFLHDAAARLVGADRVRLIPTCIEITKYPQAEHGRSGSDVRLVWIGQRSTLRYLVDGRQCLGAVAQRLPGIELRVVSDVFPDDVGIAVAPRNWSQQSEAHEIANADIGISWLSDDDWSRGKCGLKVLQYMAAGLPVVANPVGANRDMVIDGETGYLASTPNAWAAAIERLAHDPAKRRAMGEQGRHLAAERFGIDRWAPEFVATMLRLSRYEVSHVRISSRTDAGQELVDQQGKTC
jgi:glycosyltransferase involved in cell wall biosynthesis